MSSIVIVSGAFEWMKSIVCPGYSRSRKVEKTARIEALLPAAESALRSWVKCTL